jgi:hypothetical protein
VRRLYRAALWRVRNRLLLTTFLFGVVPILLIGFLLSQAAQIVLGQYASAVVRDALDGQIAAMETTARLLAGTAHTLAVATASDSAARLDAIRQQAQPIRLVIQTGGQTFTLPDVAEIREVPDWMAADFKGLVESGGRYYTAAGATAPGIRVLAYRLLDNEAWSRMTGGRVSVTVVGDLDGSGSDVNVRFDFGSGRSFIRRDGVETPLQTSGPIAAPAGGFPDKELSWLLPMDVRSVSGPTIKALLVLGSTRSLVAIA